MPLSRRHKIDTREWNGGECGKCGGPTPYCRSCGKSWCLWCESQQCRAGKKRRERETAEPSIVASKEQEPIGAKAEKPAEHVAADG